MIRFNFSFVIYFLLTESLDAAGFCLNNYSFVRTKNGAHGNVRLSNVETKDTSKGPFKKYVTVKIQIFDPPPPLSPFALTPLVTTQIVTNFLTRN